MENASERPLNLSEFKVTFLGFSMNFDVVVSNTCSCRPWLVDDRTTFVTSFDTLHAIHELLIRMRAICPCVSSGRGPARARLGQSVRETLCDSVLSPRYGNREARAA